MISLILGPDVPFAVNTGAHSLLGVEPQRMTKVAFGFDLAQRHSRH